MHTKNPPRSLTLAMPCCSLRAPACRLLRCLWPAALFAVALAIGAGCKKSSSSSASKESPLTGKPTDAPIALTPTWKPGNRYVMRLERVQNSQLPAGPRGRGGATNNAPLETTYAQEYSLTITNGAAGTRGAELEILGVELQVSRGEEQWINFDSQNKVVPRDPNNPILAAFDKLAGGKVYYQFGADNTVQKVEGVDALFKRVEEASAGGGGGRAGGFITGMLRQAMNEETFKQMVDVSGAPAKEVRIGDSWPLHKEFNAPMVGRIGLDITNTLRGWQQHEGANCARVEFAGTLTGGGTNAQRGPMGAQLAISDGAVTGHYWYDPEIGIAREVQSEQKYTVTGSFGGRRNTNAVPQKFPIRETTSVKLLEAKPAG